MKITCKTDTIFDKNIYISNSLVIKFHVQSKRWLYYADICRLETRFYSVYNINCITRIESTVGVSSEALRESNDAVKKHVYNILRLYINSISMSFYIRS